MEESIPVSKGRRERAGWVGGAGCIVGFAVLEDEGLMMWRVVVMLRFGEGTNVLRVTQSPYGLPLSLWVLPGIYAPLNFMGIIVTQAVKPPFLLFESAALLKIRI